MYYLLNLLKQLDKRLSEILEHQADAIIDGLNDKPWTGRVLSANRESIVINAGKDVGINKGKVFNVFGKGELIRSVSGRSIYLLGQKVGEIKTVKVMDSHSSATPVSGGSFKAGQVIRVK